MDQVVDEPSAAADPHRAYVFLREQLPVRFSLPDLRALCGELELDYQSVSHNTTIELADELLRYVAQRGRQQELSALLSRERDFIHWPDHFEYPSPAGARIEEKPPRPGDAPRNPFGHTGRLNGPPAYLVRQPFTGEVIHELRKGVSLSIVGETQTGKSSLLWYLTHGEGPALLGRAPADCIYLDMQLLHDEHDFFDALCEELELPSARGYKLSRALRGRKVLLALDEVEKMTWDGFTHELRSQLRGLADGAGAPLTLIIASRTPLAALFPDAPDLTSPLANLCLPLRMQPFTLAETQALVGAYLRGAGLALSPAAVAAAWQTSGGYAARLQRELKLAFDREHGAS